MPAAKLTDEAYKQGLALWEHVRCADTCRCPAQLDRRRPALQACAAPTPLPCMLNNARTPAGTASRPRMWSCCSNGRPSTAALRRSGWWPRRACRWR